MYSLNKLIKKREFKSFLFSTIVTATVYYFINLIGFNSSGLTEFLFGFLSFYCFQFIFSTKEERKRIRGNVKTFIFNNPANTTKYLIIFFLLYYFTVNQSTPKDPIMLEISKYVSSFGMIAIFLFLTTKFIYLIFKGEKVDIINLLQKTLVLVTSYVFILWLTGMLGDSMKETIVTNKEESIVFCITLLLIYSIFKLSKEINIQNQCSKTYSNLTFTNSAVYKRKLTEVDKRSVAIHESGHALVYATLGYAPKDLVVVISEFNDYRLGFVSGLSNKNTLLNSLDLEWNMLLSLAGKVAEKIIIGKDGIGSSSDNVYWLKDAKSYLSNYFNGIYYILPQNKFEQELNEEKLNKLYEQQVDMLERFFIENKKILEDLSLLLLEKKKLKKDDLIPFLSEVKISEDFPLPNGYFKKFGDIVEK